MSSNRVLIFVVAYNAEKHIRSVLDRLPKQVFSDPRFHILIIDDCSKDQTSKVAAEHAELRGIKNITVAKNPVNMGYGGNQKIGYRYAIQNNYGLVILLHGDGQYAPEMVLEFVSKWEKESADVILGSRMIEKTRARQGGMPLYKWVGNQVLTGFQNIVLGSDLSEFHTGYRAYSTKLLSKIPIELNTNDFHFDTEILLQGFAVDAKFTEFSIPTHYGDEVCHVNGTKYAWDVTKACLKYRFQQLGFFSSMKFKGLVAPTDLGLGSSEFHALLRVKDKSRVLLVTDKSQEKIAALIDKLNLKKCLVKKMNPNLDSFEQIDVSEFDTVLVLDVLETLSDPERFLVESRYSMKHLRQPEFIISVGNVAFFALRLFLGLGFFNYGELGILRVSSKRLFTLNTIKRLLRETGFEASSNRGVGIPFYLVFKGGLGTSLTKLTDWCALVWPSFFGYRLMVTARPKPHSPLLLEKAEQFYPEKETAAIR